MANYDDFDIVEDETEEKRRPLIWLWLGVILLLTIFGFAAGIAYSSLTERWADQPVPPISATVTDIATEMATVTEMATEMATDIVTEVINEPEVMTVTLAATTTQVIDQSVTETAIAAIETATPTPTDTALPTTTPTTPAPVDMVTVTPTTVDTLTPLPTGTATFLPTATLTPVSTETLTPLPTSTGTELPPAEATTALPSPTPLIPPTAVPDEPPAQSLPPSALLANLEGVRPAANGRFLATYSNDIQLDGRVEDWSNRPTAWRPMKFVVHGGQYFDGPADLSAGFQAAWSEQGLYLALIVLDELHRSGPSNEDMWQGDGLEIHFDQQLRADFDGRKADGDDYQIGVNFGPLLDHFNGYRWLPAAQRGQVPVTGAIASAAGGYVIEILIEWEVFGLSAAEVYPEDVYGFNISINDNDSNQPAQQTMISASAQRTTFDDPTEWGTLLLGRE